VAGLTLQQMLQQGYAAVAQCHPLPAYVRKAAWALLVCRTAVWGGHLQACPAGQVERVWYTSCRHRLCPHCAW
jgi:transposase-like zinc-binding protein